MGYPGKVYNRPSDKCLWVLICIGWASCVVKAADQWSKHKQQVGDKTLPLLTLTQAGAATQSDES